MVAVLVSPGGSHPPGVQCQGVQLCQGAQELAVLVLLAVLSLAMHYQANCWECQGAALVYRQVRQNAEQVRCQSAVAQGPGEASLAGVMPVVG